MNSWAGLVLEDGWGLHRAEGGGWKIPGGGWEVGTGGWVLEGGGWEPVGWVLEGGMGAGSRELGFQG